MRDIIRNIRLLKFRREQELIQSFGESDLARESCKIHYCSSRGRVVKAMDYKSIGVSPRRFESCRLRRTSLSFFGLD